MLTIPKDTYAEECLISAILLDQGLLDDAIQAGLSAESFTDVKCGVAFEGFVAIRANSEEVNNVSMAIWLQASGNQHKLTFANLARLEAVVETTIGFPAALNTVINKTAQRKALMEARALVQKLEENYLNAEDIDNAISPSLARITNAVKRQESARDINTIASEALRNLENRVSGADLGGEIYWGIKAMDKFLGPIGRHELVCIAGRPSQGKSSLSRQVAWHNAKLGKRVAIFTLETSDVSVVEACAAQEARIGPRDIVNAPADKVELYRSWLKRIKDMSNIKVYDHDMTLAAIESRLRVLKSAWKPDLVVIDYLQIIRRPPSSKSTADEVGLITRTMVEMVRFMGCPILLLSQLNRENERNNREPILSDLRDSGAIESDSHRIVFVYRKPEAPDGSDQTSDVYRKQYYSKLIQGKLRDGQKGAVDVVFQGPFTTFEDVQQTPTTTTSR